jgi:cation:H+ antiporter
VTVVLLLIALVIILASAELFTNGVEWLGRRYDLGEGAVGSVLAAVGTAMPETLVPIIAIVFTSGATADQIGIGAILGAPFMLSSLTMLITGLAVVTFALRGRRSRNVVVNEVVMRRDLSHFLLAYSLAMIAA